MRSRLRVNTLGTTRKNDSCDPVFAKFFGRSLVVINLRVDLALANTAGDHLGKLRTKI